MAHEARVHNPGCLVVVLGFPSAFLHVKISVTLFRLYIKWSLVLEHVCAGGGGGNVTFGVYNGSRHIGGVSAAFWTTLGCDTSTLP